MDSLFPIDGFFAIWLRKSLLTSMLLLSIKIGTTQQIHENFL